MVVNSDVNPYLQCHILGTNAHMSKQHNSTTNITSCCTAQDVGITALARTQDNSTQIDNIYTFLVTLTPNASSNNCDYSQYISSSTNEAFFRSNYPEIYDNTYVQMRLYNILYANQSLNASQLVPTFSGTNVSCTSGYVPYLVEVFLPHAGNIEYAYFCSNESESVIANRLNALRVPSDNSSVHFNLSYFENSDGSKCKTNSCTTSVNAYLGQATHPEYVSQKEPFFHSDGALIGFIILGVFLIGFLIWAVVVTVAYKESKKNVSGYKDTIKGYSYLSDHIGSNLRRANEMENLHNRLKLERSMRNGMAFNNIPGKSISNAEQNEIDQMSLSSRSLDVSSTGIYE